MYKALNNEAPEYLSSLLKFKKTDYSTRSEDNLELEVPKVGSYGNKAFCCAGPKLWNAIPVHIRKSENFSIFKNNLKKFYFNEAFADFI